MFTSTDDATTTSPFPCSIWRVSCATAVLFWGHVALTLYLGISNCGGYSTQSLGYALTSLVVGWTAFLCATVALCPLPIQGVCIPVSAMFVILGLAAWGAVLIANTPRSILDDTSGCGVNRLVVHCVLFSLQVLEFLGFTVRIVSLLSDNNPVVIPAAMHNPHCAQVV